MQTLFSEHWHLVKDVKPKLREAVEAFPRRLRGRSWIFLHDQATQKFIRLTPEAWLIIKKMDGKATLDSIWESSCLEQQQLHDEHRFYFESETQIISQFDLVRILGQLYSNDMLQTQYAADADEIVKRYKKQKFQKFKESFLNPISIKIPLWYPDKWFNNQVVIATKLYTWTFFIVWLVVVIPAMVLTWSNWDSLTNNLSDRVLSTSNLFILWCTYPLVKAIHEWAHGLAVKAWGGVVREIGLMLIIFMPVPYVDATYAYRFSSKWIRALVAATGVMAELFLGALAMYIWLSVESGLVRAFAFNVIFIAGVSSLLVNGNPLMRYDGYYVLSNLIEIPNLSQRAKNYWIYLSDRYFFKAKDAKPPMGYAKERHWLFIYGCIAPIYRIFIIFTLIWFVAQKYFIIGILMAVISMVMSFGVPIYKGFKHVLVGNSLMKNRVQAKRRLYLSILLVFLILFVVPIPFYSVQQGVAWLPESNIVRAKATGTIDKLYVIANQKIKPNEPLLLLKNQDVKLQYQNINQQRQGLSLQIRQAQFSDTDKYNSLTAQYRSLQLQQVLLKREVDALTIVANKQGVWYPKLINEMTGLYIKKGDIVGFIAPNQTDRVRVVIEQDDMSLINDRLKSIEVKSTTKLAQNHSATLVRKTPQAGFELPSAAMGVNAGGEVVVDPNDTSGLKSVERVFDVELHLSEQTMKASQPISFNDRVYVRFDLGYLPLGWQWLIRARQLFLKNFNI